MEVYILLICTVIVSTTNAAVSEDLVTSLPGLIQQPKFKHYSGYLKATGTKRLHYWFIEAQSSPESAPVVLWMNGGPGCSSMDGLLSEHGPFRVADQGKSLRNNSYSWNLVANMLYLEAPAGVGYSYSLDKNYTTDDDEVSLDNYYALKYFFMKYSEYANNDFYITGESYGGIYVPTLAARVVEDKQFKFKGFAVGNGISDFDMNGNSIIYFAYFHGLFGDSLWLQLVSNCCVNGNTSNCNFAKPPNVECMNAVGQAGMAIQELNVYNMYAECYQPKVDAYNRTIVHSTSIMLGGSPVFRPKATEFYAMMRSSDKVALSPPCIDATAMTTYMNRADVRSALHIYAEAPRWDICSNEVAMHYKRTYDNMRDQYLKVLSTGQQKILVYNGDIDMACNFLMDEWFTDSLGLKVEVDTRSWKYTAADGSQQVGGYVKHFENLTYTTVRGAGHMVPTDRPIPALYVFKAFLEGKQL